MICPIDAPSGPTVVQMVEPASKTTGIAAKSDAIHRQLLNLTVSSFFPAVNLRLPLAQILRNSWAIIGISLKNQWDPCRSSKADPYLPSSGRSSDVNAFWRLRFRPGAP